MELPLDATSKATDEELLQDFSNGDPAAARALTLRFLPRVLGFATRMLHDRHEAEDVAQEAMLRLWKMGGSWQSGEAKVSTWLYRVVSNLCTDRLRRKRTVPIDTIAEPEDKQATAHAVLLQADRAQALEAALGALPKRQREAIILRHLEELSNPDIAQIMGVSVEAVESLTARAKRTLTKLLAPRKTELGFEDDK